VEKVIQVTDPATELADLIERLRPAGKRNPSGFAAVAGVMKVNLNDVIFFDLLAIGRQRMDFVQKIIPEFAELDGQLASEASRPHTRAQRCFRSTALPTSGILQRRSSAKSISIRCGG